MSSIYLNNATTSWPKAPGVGRVMQDAVQAPLPIKDASLPKDARALLGHLMGDVDPGRIVYVSSAMLGLGMTLLGYPWRWGSVVLTTAAEHRTVLQLLHQLKRVGTIKHVILPVDEEGRLEPDAFLQAIRRFHPCVAVFSHANPVTGAQNDMEVLCRIAQENGVVTLVDASLTAGLLPVLPKEWGADMVAFSGHRYLLGPTGIGGIYFGNDAFLHKAGGSRGVGGPSPYSTLSQRLESDSLNIHGLAGLYQALQWAEQNPLDFAKLMRLTDRLEEGLLDLNVNVLRVTGTRMPILSFRFHAAEDAADLLSSYGIICGTGLQVTPLIHPHLGVVRDGVVRFSLSRFTTREEIEQTIAAMREVVQFSNAMFNVF